jgi:hypothetical protein
LIDMQGPFAGKGRETHAPNGRRRLLLERRRLVRAGRCCTAIETIPRCTLLSATRPKRACGFRTSVG